MMDKICAIPGTNLALPPDRFPDPLQDIDPALSDGDQVAVLAGGCFWCVEAVYKQVDGVLDVNCVYAGGSAETADYHSVCSGTTEHAEAVWLRFDPARISYGQLLKLFFTVAHDPTQLNRQGNDRGRQYRSAIFYADELQKSVATAYIQQLNQTQVFTQPIVTTLESLHGFFEAEAYHQNYAALNPEQPYIAMISMPKVDKLKRYFPQRLKMPT